MADEQLAPLPTALDPARLATLFPQPATSAPAAPSAPPSAAPSGDITQEMIEASRQGRQVFTGEVGRSHDLSSQIQELIRQQQATPIPKMGWTDTQGKPQQGGFLHNLGRVMMTLGGATGPGQAIQAEQYGPGIKRYEAETGARAKQIEELRGQQEEAGKTATAGAGMVSKPITAAGQVMRGQAALERANAYVPLAAAQATAALKGIDLKKAAIDEKVRNDMVRELQAKIDEQGRNFRATNKDATEEEVARVLAGSREAIANEVSARNPSLWNQIKNYFGVETPQLPSAPQPQLTPTPQKPTKPAASAAPARPKGVPADAKWDAKTKTWYK